MLLGLFGGRDVGELIARRKYEKAIELLRAELERGVRDPRLRNQLADVLIMAGREREAVPVLIELADEYAAEHQAPKAIALLKKIQRIEPGRSDAAARLATLIKEKGRARPRSAGYQPREGLSAEGYEPAGAVFGAEHFESKPVVSDSEKLKAARRASWVPSTHQEPQEEFGVPRAEIAPEPDAAVSDDAFRGQLLDVIQDVLHAQPPAPEAPSADVALPQEVPESPLFSGFSHEELVAVMQGLRLLSFEPGDIILTEGDPGDSLFVVTTGVVKAFVRTPGEPGQRLVRRMSEGDFFGEISILSGKPRTATITATTACELLELDRATLEGIEREHPGVRKVLEDFYVARAAGD